MSEKRRDKKGRILKTGECQREDGRYMFRYTVKGQRACFYDRTLEGLRIKEANMQRDILDGIKISGDNLTVSELVDRYMNLKRGWKENTRRGYETAFNRIKESALGSFNIHDIKLSDAKLYYIGFHDKGYKRSTIQTMHSLLQPAFEMALEDDLLRKNPFHFRLCDILANDAGVRNALTPEQQDQYLRFFREYGDSSYYDEIVILLGTGLRVSELYGLTKSDIDLEKRNIRINKQLCRTADMPYFITGPKTRHGNRIIPMTETVFQTIEHVLKSRPNPKVETIIDGCGSFLFIDKYNKPKVGMHLQNYMRLLRAHHPWVLGDLFPTVTPHVLRHTFCTNMMRAGIDVKSLQYLMGHSSASVTLDVYTHTDYATVKQAFDSVACNL